MPYHQINLSAEQLSSYLAAGELESMDMPMESSPNWVLHGTLSESDFIGVHDTLAYRIAQAQGGQLGRTYIVFLSGCHGDECRRRETGLAHRADRIQNWDELPGALEISAVLYGDVNRDGHFDIALQLSDGTGILFQSMRIEPPRRPGIPIPPGHRFDE